MSRISVYLRSIDNDAIEQYYNLKNYTAGKISRKEYLRRKSEIKKFKQLDLDVSYVAVK